MSDGTDLAKITGEKETPKDTQIAKVESDLQKERDSRCEERFFGAFIILLVADCFILPNASSISGVVALVTLQLVFLVVLAACLGLESVSVFISSILSKFMDKHTDKDK